MHWARALLLAGAFTVGCAPAPAAAPPVPVTELVYDMVAEVDFTQMTRHERGYYWRDFIVGEGRQAQPGLEVRIGYVVRLPDGTEVDRADPERPMVFKLGERQSIAAMELALRSMREGGSR